MAKKDRELDKEKRLFLQEVKQAFRDPISYFDIYEGFNHETGKLERKCNEQKLERFFQTISTLWLDSEVGEFVKPFPKIKFKQKLISSEIGSVGGMYNRENNEIWLSLDSFLMGDRVASQAERFLRKGKVSSLHSYKIADMIITLCHEHQHFKQYEYSDAVKDGENDKAEYLKSFIGGLSGEILKDVSPEGEEKYATDLLNFLKKMKPESYQRIRSYLPTMLKVTKNSKRFFRKGGEILPSEFNIINYLGRALEIDARETSLRQFKKIKKDFGRSMPFETLKDMDSLHFGSILKNIGSRLFSSKKYLSCVWEESKKINVDDLIEYSEQIDVLAEEENEDKGQLYEKMQKAVVNGEKITPLLSNVKVLSNVLDFVIKDKPKEKQKEILEDIISKSGEGSFIRDFVRKVLEGVQETDEIKEGSFSEKQKDSCEAKVEKVSHKELLSAGAYDNQEGVLIEDSKKNLGSQIKKKITEELGDK